MGSALDVVLELTRGKDAAVDEGHPLGDTEYLLRHGDGAFRSGRFPWSDALHQDLQAVHQARPDPQALQRVGNVLRTFFDGLGWATVEEDIREALEAEPPREVRITFRCGAGELCRLPLELLTLRATGKPLVRTSGVHVQWEWPDTSSAPEEPKAPPEGGTLLLAWSTAGGGLDSQAQLRILRRARVEHQVPRTAVVEAPNVSLQSLTQALEEVRARKEAVAVLHLLCHGGRLKGGGGAVGLSLNGPGDEAEVVDPGSFASALEPFAGLVRCVVLCACEGASLGDTENVLGSVAQSLHRARFPAVVASRVPLSIPGAEAFTAAFYPALLAGEPFHRAVAIGRSQIGREWAALQVYARAADSPHCPVIFRPYRGLQSFEAQHRRFFFGREALTQELLARVEEAAQGQRRRFQVVAGTSGSGKSSLVKAGLLPELPNTWRVVLLRPGGGELDSHRGLALLSRGLRGVQGPQAEPGQADEAAVMLEARRLRERHPGQPVLLVVDQLEEAFQLPGDEPQRFLGCLWRLAKDEALGFIVLSTFRADLIDRAQEMVLGDGVSLQSAVYRDAHRLFVPGLEPQELLEAIQRPLEAVGLRFEPGVAEQIRDEAGKEPGVLPLLEHALDTLWRARDGKRLTRAAYEQLGLTGALSRQLDRMWDDLPAEQQHQGRRLLVGLVDISDEVSLSTRRRRQTRELRPSGEAAAEAFDAVLECLAAERLVVRGQDEGGGGESWVEIAHEALIRRWPRLQQWLREGLADHKLERDLEKAAEGWLAHKNEKDRGRSYLPEGGRLEAFEALQARAGPLPATQQDFIAAACAKRRQAKRRTRLAIAALSAGLLSVSAVSIVALAQWRVATHERNVALSRELTALVGSRLDTGDPQLNLALLRKASDLARTEQLVPTLVQWAGAPGRVFLKGHSDAVVMAAFSPDGLRVVTASGDRTARVWDAASGKPLATLSGHSEDVNTAAFSPDGFRVVTASGDGTARVWDAASGNTLATLSGHSGDVWTAAFSPDGLRVVTASSDGTARVWDAASGKPLATLSGHSSYVPTAAFSPDGLRVVTASADKTARVWDAASGKPLATLSGHSRHVLTAAFSPDGLRVVTASYDRTARVWDAASGKPLATLSDHSGSVNTAAFSPDGLRVVTASRDGTARVWDAASGKPLATLSGHSSYVLTAAFSPDGLRVVTASGDRTARVWDAASGKPLATLSGHSRYVRTAAFSPDGLRVVTASEDNTARVWDAASGKPLATLSGHSGSVNTAAFSPDGLRVVTASYDRTARVWDAASGKPLATLSGHSGSVNAAAFSPDGLRVVTASGGGTARVWDTASGKPLATLSDGLGTAAFSPDGLRVVTASGGGTARVWDTASGKLLSTLAGHSIIVWTAAFSPDGLRVVTTSWDKIARVWDAASGKPLATLSGHSDNVQTAAFSPDGLRVVTTSGDNTARVWDVASGKLLATLSGHSNSVMTAAFSPDGLRVVTASGDGTARVWRDLIWAPPAVQEALLQSARDLTPEERRTYLHEE